VAITVVDTAFAYAENEPITITHGFTIQSGDVIVAFMNQNAGQDAGLGAAFSDNNGANSFVKQLEYWATPSTTASDAALAIFHRVAGGSEPASYSFNGSSPATQVWAIGLIQLRGVDNNVIWDVPPQWLNLGENLTGTAHSAPSITTVTDNALALYLVGGDARNLYSTPTNGFTDANITGAVQNTDWALGGAYKTITTAGAVGATQMTAGSSNDGGAMLMALRADTETDLPSSFRTISGALAENATNSVDFIVPGIGTIAGAIVYTNRATVEADFEGAAGTAWFCSGFWDGTTQVCYAHHSEDGLTTPSLTDSWNMYSNNKIAMWCNNAGTVQFAATISGITDGVRITTNTADGAQPHRVTVILIPSSVVSNIDCQVIDASGINASGVVEVTNVGFEADAVFVLAGKCTANETVDTDFTHSFGIALNQPGEPNFCMNLIEDDGRDMSAQTTYLSNITNNVHCAMRNTNGGIAYGMRITNFDASGFTTTKWNQYVRPLSTADTGQEDYLTLAIKFNAGYYADCNAYRSPVPTGDWDVIGPGFKPSFGLVLGSEGVNDMNSGESSQSESFSMIPFDGRSMHSIGYCSADNTATVFTSCFAMPGWHMVEDGGGIPADNTYVGTLASLDDYGFTINFSNTPGTGTRDFWNIFVIGHEPPKPTFRGSNWTYDATGTATNVDVDSISMDLRPNDVLVAIAHINNNPTLSITGFTSEFQEENPTVSTSHHAFLHRVVDGTERASSNLFNFSWGTGETASCYLLHFRGTDTGQDTKWDVAPSASTRSHDDSVTTLSSPPSMTTTYDESVGIAAFFGDAAVTFSAYTNGYSNESEDGITAPDPGLAIVVKPLPTAGSQGTVNATRSATGDMTGHQIALSGKVNQRVQYGNYDSGGNSVATIPITLPVPATAGNLLVAVGSVDKSCDFLDPPAGWTRIITDNKNAGVSQQYIYKFAAGGETGVTISPDNISRSCSGIIAEYSGVDTLGVTAQNSQATPSQSCASGTTASNSQNPALAIAFFGADSAQNVFDVSRTYSNSFVEHRFIGAASAGTPSAQIADKVITATGTVDTTFTTGDTGDEMLGAVAVFYLQSGPVITDVANSGETPGSGTETWQDGSTGNVITGTGFVA
jgi:hypothetical protein